jgi:hypothetical protein
MKKILVANYSQSGQLDEVVDNFLKPFENVQIDRIRITPRKPFPFPWTMDVFIDAMPETVLEEAIELEPIHYAFEEYDLIILGYQPWFLSPSLPVTALLQSERFCAIIKNKPVVTLIGSRNMWLNSQESVKAYLRKAGAKLVANIPLIDRVQNQVSAITIVHWMLTGRKDKKWGIFPKPGISDQDIQGVSDYGVLVAEALQAEQYSSLQDKILSLGRISVPTDILFIEQKAKRLFRIWAGLIKAKGTTPQKRAFWTGAFKYYLMIALFGVAPVLLLSYNLLVRPFTQSSIKKKKKYFCSVEN